MIELLYAPCNRNSRRIVLQLIADENGLPRQLDNLWVRGTGISSACFRKSRERFNRFIIAECFLFENKCGIIAPLAEYRVA